MHLSSGYAGTEANGNNGQTCLKKYSKTIEAPLQKRNSGESGEPAEATFTETIHCFGSRRYSRSSISRGRSPRAHNHRREHDEPYAIFVV
jgi:hypothetical protein